MSTTPEAPFVQHTVAVWLPGTDARVLINKLACSEPEAIELARSFVMQIANSIHTARARVVRTDEITNVYPPRNPDEQGT